MNDAAALSQALSAIPDDREIAEWERLPRDEQLRRLREHLAHPDCAVLTDDTMDDILAAARTRVADRNA